MFARPTISLTTAIILAVAPALVLTPAAVAREALPALDLQRLCKVEAYGGVSTTNDYDACITDEKGARDQLAKNWSSYPASDTAQCVQPSGYLASYIEWLTCLEMQRDVSKMHQERTDIAPPGSGERGPNGCPVVQMRQDGSLISMIAC